MIEEWKDIKDYEGLYKVSNLGSVMSLNYRRSGNNKLLKINKHHKGYCFVNLNKNNVSKYKQVHRLVAETFIPNPENKPTVNHIDEDKTNNVVSNIEWATMKEQCNHGTRTERISHKIIAIDIANGEYNYYDSIRACARMLNIDATSITRVISGKQKHVGGFCFEKQL